VVANIAQLYIMCGGYIAKLLDLNYKIIIKICFIIRNDLVFQTNRFYVMFIHLLQLLRDFSSFPPLLFRNH